MSEKQDAVFHALRDLTAGIRELGGQNKGPPAKLYMRGDELPWCAGAVLTWYERAGTPIHRSTREYYDLRAVARFEAEMIARGVWMGPRLRPRRGDLVFFQARGESDPGRGRHMGIVERVCGGDIYAIEGNRGDKVARATYQLKDNTITGFARPLEF